MTSELLTPDEIAQILKIERKTFVDLVSKRPDFPSPVRLAPKILRWHRIDVQDWIERATRRSA